MNGKNATGAPSFLDSISPDGRWTNPDGVLSRSAANQRATNAAREISGGCLICTASAVAAPPEPAGDKIGDERTIDETREYRAALKGSSQVG